MMGIFSIIPKTAQVIILIIISSVAAFTLGGMYKVKIERAKIQIETAVQAAKYQSLRSKINEKSSSEMSVSHFCTSVLGLSDGDRKACMRRLGKINTPTGDSSTDIQS